MALTNNQMAMIEYISKNDLSMAKKAALACLVEDNSKKNASEVSYKRLRRKPQTDKVARG